MLKIAKAIAGNTDFLTCQAFFFEHQDTEEDSLSCLATIILASGDEAFTKVRIAGLDLDNGFFDSELPIAERLKECLSVLLEKLKGLESPNIILAFWQAEVLHILSEGGNKAYLLRVGQVIDLVEAGGTGQLISGNIESGDKLLLISGKTKGDSGVLQIVSPEKELVEQLIKVTPENLEDALENYLSNLEVLEPIATLIIENPLPLQEELKGKNTFLSRFNLRRFLPKGFSFNKRFRIILVLVFLGLISLSIIGFIVFNKKDQVTEKNVTQKQASKEQKEPSKKLEIKEFPLFLSLDLIKKDFKGRRLSHSLGKILILDENSKSLSLIDLANKNSQLLAGSPQLGKASFSSLNGDNAFVFSEDKGIVRVDSVGKKAEVVIKPDPQWGRISDIFAFSGNVYLLDSLKNQIWKYVPIASGYTDKTTYLNEDKTDLSGSRKLFIDYSVWSLKGEAELIKFTAGNKDFFSIGGLEEGIEKITSFFAPEEEDKIYVLDSENSRIIILKKNGEFINELKGDKFKTASDLVIDEKAKKLYLLENNKIYQIDLK